ncbi:MAG: hypothetical protein ABDI19_11165, partial [Armatimonadota bacterium]
MVRRWWLILSALIIGTVAFGQDTASQRPWEEVYRNRPNRHTLPNQRPRVIPRQNYKEVPSFTSFNGYLRWQKEGLFNPRRFHEIRQAQSGRRTRAPRWDRDLTNAPTDELHPVYVSRATRMFFASNATRVDNGRLSNPGPFYRIWRGDLDDGSNPDLGQLTNYVQITGDTPDERFSSQIQPSLSQNGHILAYASRSASGSYNIIIRNLTTNQRVVLTTDNDGITQNLHPTVSPGGNLVVFSSNRLEEGETEANRQFRLYIARTDGRPLDNNRQFFRRITSPEPGQNDIEPAWSPAGDQIAFVRTFPDGSSYIFLINPQTLNVVQWTNFVDNNGNRPRDRQPAWVTTAEGSVFILFASNRKSLDNQGRHQRLAPANSVDVTNRIFDIYRISALISEELGAVPVSLTADPSTPALARPNYPGDPETFAGAQYPTSALVERNRIAYQSTRLNEAQNQGPHDIWETFASDTVPPTIEILPVVNPKEVFPGDEITIRIRVVDFQSGVQFVRVQFKDPDSAEQDAEGLEHKIYLLSAEVVDTGNIVVPVFIEIGQQAIHPETYEYKDPYVLAFLGFDGRLDDTLALRYVPEDPNNPDPTQSGRWEVKWRTPDVESDFYLDVIVRDNAGNEFIYDNISGFTTKRFVGANKILLVSDYAAGQMF